MLIMYLVRNSFLLFLCLHGGGGGVCVIAKGLIESKHNFSVKYRISFTSIGTFFFTYLCSYLSLQ